VPRLAGPDRHDESAVYFSRAESLDPTAISPWQTSGGINVQTGDYAAAKVCFERSLHLEWNEENVIAHAYLGLVKQKLADKASGKSP